MSLMYCHECGKQISDEVRFCIYCGAKNLKNPCKKNSFIKKTLILLITFVVSFLLVAIYLPPTVQNFKTANALTADPLALSPENTSQTETNSPDIKSLGNLELVDNLIQLDLRFRDSETLAKSENYPALVDNLFDAQHQIWIVLNKNGRCLKGDSWSACEPDDAKPDAANLDTKPSFDCKLAKTTIENIICSDPQVAKLDGIMAIRYNSSLAYNNDIVQEQAAWRNDVRDKCADSDCLVLAYASRILDIVADDALVRANQ